MNQFNTFQLREIQVEIRAGCMEVLEQLTRDLARLKQIETESDCLDELIVDLEYRLWSARGALAAATRLVGMCDEDNIDHVNWRDCELALINNLVKAEEGWPKEMEPDFAGTLVKNLDSHDYDPRPR